MKHPLLVVAIGAGFFACSDNPSGDPDSGGNDSGADAQQEAGPPNPNGGNLPDGYPNVDLPQVGATALHVVSPTVIEVEKITTKAPDPAPVTEWDYASAPPAPSSFTVKVNGAPATVTQVGFKRRPLYAPLKTYDLRIKNDLYLVLSSPVADGASVTVD